MGEHGGKGPATDKSGSNKATGKHAVGKGTGVVVKKPPKK
jgi:hypothetical protein